MNKYSKYPIGHPKIITEHFEDLENYFGLIKCKVLPPRELFLPVLPHKCKGKLMFPLCLECANIKSQTPCNHNDEQRSFIGTWISEELKLAVNKGYKIVKVLICFTFLINQF